MENKRKAIAEVLGHDMGLENSKKFFYNVYEYFLYNDTDGFLEILDLRMSLNMSDRSLEDYYVFKHMLRLLMERHPHKLASLCPTKLELPNENLPDTSHKTV